MRTRRDAVDRAAAVEGATLARYRFDSLKRAPSVTAIARLSLPAWPTAVGILAVWLVLFALWFLLGIPLGPGSPVGA